MWPFDANNQQMYQQYAKAWDQGTYNQLSNQEVQQNYQQFVQNARRSSCNRSTNSTSNRHLPSSKVV